MCVFLNRVRFTQVSNTVGRGECHLCCLRRAYRFRRQSISPSPNRNQTPHILHRNSKNAIPSSPINPLLPPPQSRIADRRERKRQFKPHVAPVPRRPDMRSDRPDEPHLRHPQHGAHDAETEGDDGREAGRQALTVVPRVDVVDAFLEDEVFGEGYPFVDCEPVALERAGLSV